MQADTIGRVKNIRLPVSKPLLPLFEAIVNSLDAIEEGGDSRGEITIRVEREVALSGMPEDYYSPVVGFEVVDNGVGFNHRNYESFETSDTRYKEGRGARGVGRFLWLKAFDHVEVDSQFHDNGGTFRRQFHFALTDKGVENHTLIEDAESSEPRTRLRLVQFAAKYQEKCPLKPETIAHQIVEHCLVFFLKPDCPRILLADSARIIVLNEVFSEEFKKEAETHHFEIRGNTFALTLFRVLSPHDRAHKLLFVANSREVYDEKLDRLIPDMRGGIASDDGLFFFVGCVAGDYLDAIVNPERTELYFPAESDDLVETCITEKELRDSLSEIIAKAVEPHVAPMREEKVKRIRHYIEEEAPKYRTLFKYAPEQIGRIPASASGATLEVELARVQFQVDEELRTRKQKLLANERGVTSRQDYEIALKEFIEKYDDMGKAKLADYVAHRRVVIEFLDRALQQQDDGKYPLEAVIHDLLCPRRTSTDEVSYDSLNLWIVDERFAYHFYLASDLSQDKIPVGDFDSRMRPDIAVFNRPIAFAEGEAPYETITVLEFKRAGRDDYTDEDNPMEQVLDLVERFREGRMLDRDRKIIRGNINRKFYCYVVCDFTPRLQKMARRFNFIETPDGQGFFYYHTEYSAYIEIIGFDKLLKDARQRNRILFDKLNII